MSQTHILDSELRDLWSRKSSLDNQGWTRLYEIVCQVLLPYRPRELSGLSEDRIVYVEDFFHDKVFRPDLLSPIDHIGALQLAYKRYLLDRIRDEKRHRAEEYVAGDPEDEDVRAPTDIRSLTQRIGEDEFASLRESGLDPLQVGESAMQWLKNAEAWIPIYLGLHFCPDTESTEALYKLAKRMNIASHHYKAEKLGITGAFDGDYGDKTMIGCWLTGGLGIQISQENRSLVLVALKILCFQALYWVEQQEVTS